MQLALLLQSLFTLGHPNLTAAAAVGLQRASIEGLNLQLGVKPGQAGQEGTRSDTISASITVQRIAVAEGARQDAAEKAGTHL